MTSSTVRQDLSYLDFSGVSKRGYETCKLQKVLASILGADAVWHMVVVGAGNLGRALAMHEEFSRCGFLICGIFDCDEKKIGKKVGRLLVESMRNLPLVIKQRKVDIGIIAVPSSAAQGVVEILIASGIRGILNLASTHIAVPANVAIIDARIVASLHELSYAINL